ncbi:MAG TPA: phytanoyl-CoA dioxygenase family protein [Pseudomonadales bacterium]
MNDLTAEELSFFKHYGYLLKRRALDTALCAEVLDRMWDSAPPSLKRNDPTTWHAVPPEEESDDPLRTVQGTRWQLREASCEQAVIDLAFCPQLVAWAEQLLGRGMLRQPTVGGQPMGSWGPAWPGGPVDPQLGEGVRGIYATLPSERAAPRPPNRLHTDGHPFHLGVVCLLDDCPPDGGALRIWPASHRRFYPLFPMQYDQARIPFYPHMPSHKGLIHPPEYLAEVGRVEADTESVDCWGRRGDVVLWHHRLGHMAGVNIADPPAIRQALLFDFCGSDLDRQRLDPPQPDMWRDWSEELRSADAPVTAQLAAEQRLPLSMLE